MTPGEGGTVRVETTDGVATVTLDRPEQLNALDSGVLAQLDSAFGVLERDNALAGVVITGGGQRAFVAGADLREIASLDRGAAIRISRLGQRVFDRIESFPKPVVAAVGGFALGGGCELALACHFRVASEDAQFGLPEVGLGLIPGFGGTVRLPRLVGVGRALDIILTGRRVTAEEAQNIGLVHAVVPRSELAERALTLVGDVARRSPLAVSAALRSVYHGLDLPASMALEEESALFGAVAGSEDAREGVAAFLEKRAPRFLGR